MDSEEIASRVAERAASARAAGCAALAGAAGPWREEQGGETELFFDLASVTKPMTAVAVACAGIDLRTPLGALVAEAKGTSAADVPLELFLAHRAGLPAHLPLHAPLLRGGSVDASAALRQVAEARRSDARGDPPAEGFAPLYSDLGYILAGEALARATGARDAGAAIASLLLLPLGVADRAGTIRELSARGIDGPFAPTEDVAWRGGVVRGAVHDENAWALTGRGGSGHAGIFGTVGAVLAFGEAVLDALDGRGGGPLSGHALGWLVRERPGGTLRAGFDGKSPHGSSAGERMGSRTFGHLGFTGTSLWVDPDAKVVVSLLTNRVFPSRDSVEIKAVRPRVHDALFERAAVLRGFR